MTDEFPRPAGSSDPELSAADRDPFTSLGLGFTEESPVISTPVIATPAITPPSRDLVVLPDTVSTELVTLGRRAQREAERDKVMRPSRRATTRTDAPTAAVATVAVAAHARAVVPAAAAVIAAAARPLQSRVPLARRIAKKAFPPAVMLAAAALLVGTSVPANALFDPEAPPASVAMSNVTVDANGETLPAPEGQVIEAEAADQTAATAATRDEWTVTSYAQLLQLKYGNRSFSYSTTGTGAVRWPFPYAVPISSGFGERSAPCRGCSSYHQGLDFTPGSGTPIYAIADGVVLQSEFSGGFGQHAIIEHVINGQRITSSYAHMTGGSSPLVVGQQVLVGDFVGTVGDTGVSTGAHLHLEIRIDGIAIDPFQWFQANAS